MTAVLEHRMGPTLQAMGRGSPVVLEPEVQRWLEGLPTEQFAQAAVHIDRLGQPGSLTRQLGADMGELRFHVGREPYRVTYWIAPDMRIVLLTVFRRCRTRDRREIERAARVLTRCVADRFVAEVIT